MWHERKLVNTYNYRSLCLDKKKWDIQAEIYCTCIHEPVSYSWSSTNKVLKLEIRNKDYLYQHYIDLNIELTTFRLFNTILEAY